MNDFFGSMFGKIAPGMCRLSMTGEIAVKTDGGYKSFNTETGRLTNCDNFVFNIGEEFFFLIPTNRVKKGDIILVNGKPRCVIEAGKNSIKALNYSDSTLENIIPERMVFLGNTYMYGKIVSMFGSRLGRGKKGPGKIFKYMMLSEMMKGNKTEGINMLLPMMLMGQGGMDDMFGGMFDMDSDDDDEEDDKEDKNELESLSVDIPDLKF